MIPEHQMILYAVNCSECGQPTVVSEVDMRPDLCYPCFGAWLAGIEWTVAE